MNLAEMRSTLRTMLAGLADDAIDVSIDDRLNGAYQYTLPMEIDGELVEGEWVITTVAGTGEYAYDATVAQVMQVAPRLDDTYWLSYHTRPDVFWQAHDRTGGVQQRPDAALFYGRTAYLRPIPDAAYSVRVFTRKFPSALTSDGLVNRDHALAVVYAAAREYAMDVEDDETAMKADARYKDKRDLLQTLSLSTRSQERKRMRTF